MPELRKDPITRRWVIIATERGKRPIDFQKTTEVYRKTTVCPFCPGNEEMTPPEVLSYRAVDSEPNKEGWWIRVVPNRFPALAIEGDLNREGVGVYDKMNGVGAHEVIVETPDHNVNLEDMLTSQIEEIIWAYRDRYLDLKKDPRFRYILIFRNYGIIAGATLEHPHSQLIATPIIPKRVLEETEGSQFYYQLKERCIYCDIYKQEKNFGGERLVMQSAHFIVFTPFASRFPFECCVLPKEHSPSFGDITNEERKDLAAVLKETMGKIAKVLNLPAYNYVIHTSPCDTEANYKNHYHWHIEIIPRITTPAGFEWGSGFYINPTSPEDAAVYLRQEEG